MRFHCNTNSYETIAYLRERAVATKQPPGFIDAIDALASVEDIERQLAERDEELNKTEEARDDLREELSMLMDQMQIACDILELIDNNRAGAGPAEFYDAADLKTLQRQLGFAQKALERHK